MAKRKKHPKMPNGYGSIRYLGCGRALPYAVHPPAERDKGGLYVRSKPICYAPDWYTGFAVLTAYHAGKYEKGMEIDLKYDGSDIDTFCQKILSHAVYKADSGVTFEQAYKSFCDWKFGENAPKKLSKQARYAYAQGYKHLSVLKDKPIENITIDDLQQLINKCEKKKATRENIALCAKNVWKYAVSREMCSKDVARYIIVPSGRENTHGVPFSDEELAALWADCDDPICRLVLIMCYSGFRVGALPGLDINTVHMYFQGGLKTAAGKNRIVPIHSAIQRFCPFVVPANHQAKISAYLKKRGQHTAHDCRHTFSMLCERYGVNEADRKRMLGHSFGADLTNGIYGHRTLEELRKEIEKICV